MNSRPVEEGREVKRRRVCLNPACRYRWNTLELPESSIMRTPKIPLKRDRIVT